MRMLNFDFKNDSKICTVNGVYLDVEAQVKRFLLFPFLTLLEFLEFQFLDLTM